MGLFGNLMNKIGTAMEKSMSKNLSGESKEQYEKDQAEKLEKQASFEQKQNEIKEELELHTITATKTALKDLESLLSQINVLDNRKIWVGGFDNYKLKQNSKVVNMFSGNTNIKTISVTNDIFYLCKFDGTNFLAYKSFKKDQVISVDIEGFMSKKIRIKLNDNTQYSVDVTENKDKINELKNEIK